MRVVKVIKLIKQLKIYLNLESQIILQNYLTFN